MTAVLDPPIVVVEEDNPDAVLAAQLADFELTPQERAMIPGLVDVVWAFTGVLTGMRLYPYQEEFGRRFIESVISNDGDEVTALFSRQSGKTELVACVVGSLMVMLPTLAKIPMFRRILAKFEHGVLVGTFAPVGEQADTLYDRAKERLTSDHAKAVLSDPEIDDEVEVKGNFFRLKKSRSLIRVQTAHPKAKVESKTYHVILIDEAQGADEHMVTKSISPMGAATNATQVLLGTPDITQGYFYKAIKRNKRQGTERGGRSSHFQFDWKTAAKYNPNYAKYIKKEIKRLGKDSDEFRMSYGCEWILERGMFVTQTAFEFLGDKSMQRIKSWPGLCVAGIDPARKIDSTVVTVVWVDWDRPNENGLYHHRILDWLEMPGEGWEEQYFRMVEFLSSYNVHSVGVDEGGMGDAVVDRLTHLLPGHINVHPLGSSPKEQSKRWKHLTNLLTGAHDYYGRLLAYPSHAATRRTKTYKRFFQQMTELEKNYQGPYMLAEAPDEAQAHDDFCDSLALACILSTEEFEMPEIDVSDNFLMSSGRH